ncbi:MAG TPA: hypothetical protein VEM93_02410, partial [Actinomycetota bacterium]|nr:hypothetical protein [Actinomycetota bacterium]
ELLAPSEAEVVLIVDQFEETFTLCADEREREQFLDSLRVATVDPESRLRVVLTLRADFYDRPLTYPRFGELLAASTEAVPPLTPDELEQAIRKPAEQVGVSAEPGLVAEMIAEVAHQLGALPLLQYALTELFERRDDDRMTLGAHRELGGVAAALSARADRILETTDPRGRRAIKQVFLKLVTLGEGTQDTRRRVLRSELDALEVDPAAIDGVLDAFGRHRFITFDRDPATREPTVEIAHEALLTAWGRLRSWIEDAREDLRQERRLARAAAEWRGSDRDPSFLMRGARLEQLAAWDAATDLAIGQPERAYLKASLDQRDRERAEEEERRAREVRMERRSRTRLRALVAVFAMAALVAGTLSVVAKNQSERAGREARRATARELASAAVANLDVDPERSILLAIQAVDETRSVDGTVLPEAEEALHRAVTASRVVLTVRDLGGKLDWSPAGVFVTEGPELSGMIDIRDASTGEQMRRFKGHDGEVTGVAFSSDGSKLATTGVDGWLKVWDPSTGDLLASLSGNENAFSPSFSADGSLVAAAWGDTTVQVLDTGTSGVVWNRHVPRNGDTDIALSPDGRYLATVGDRSGFVLNLDTGERDFELKGAFGPRISWSPDRRYIASTGIDGTPRVWDAKTGRLLFTLPGHVGFVVSLAWSPHPSMKGSDELVTGGTDGVAKVWSIRPDGNRVMAGGAAVKIWDLGPNGDAEWANIRSRGPAEFLPDERVVAPGVDATALAVWDARTGRNIRTIARAPFDIFTLDVSPDGRYVAAATYENYDCPPRESAGVWDMATGKHVFIVHSGVEGGAVIHCDVLDLAFSRDG